MMPTSAIHKTIFIWLTLLFNAGHAMANNFDIFTSQQKASIYYDKECALDSIAANLLAADIERICGYHPVVSADMQHASGNVIIIGSIHANIIRPFQSKLDVGRLENQWECYGYRLLTAPLKQIQQALFIIGSDYRGTAYGVFDLSARIGVSAWYWWAHAPS